MTKKNINNKVCFCKTFSAADEGTKIEKKKDFFFSVPFQENKKHKKKTFFKKSENHVFNCFLLYKVFFSDTVFVSLFGSNRRSG